ncbi:MULTISPECIES: hypothetical protein [Priestia]|jgi:hypothetical protein|uniref:hypothetical protein n=1 Tax=Priestia TaxID=2800373 RepID=UPI0011A0662F|nr:MULTISPECIES: hypothetical protein [Priestia]MCM3255524.1 hypothetical protein [Priestia aryabhattai]MCM3644641.1 hypothetical protein [Priestia aryabhattai]
MILVNKQVWVTIQKTHMIDPSAADGLGCAVAYGGIAAVPISLAIGIYGNTLSFWLILKVYYTPMLQNL